MRKLIAVFILLLALANIFQNPSVQAQTSTNLECTEEGFPQLTISGFDSQELITIIVNGEEVSEFNLDDNGSGMIVLDMVEPGTVAAIEIGREDGSRMELFKDFKCLPPVIETLDHIEISPQNFAALVGYDYLLNAEGFTSEGEGVFLKHTEWAALLGNINGGKYTATTAGEETITATDPETGIQGTLQFSVFDPAEFTAPVPEAEQELCPDCNFFEKVWYLILQLNLPCLVGLLGLPLGVLILVYFLFFRRKPSI